MALVLGASAESSTLSLRGAPSRNAGDGDGDGDVVTDDDAIACDEKLLECVQNYKERVTQCDRTKQCMCYTKAIDGFKHCAAAVDCYDATAQEFCQAETMRDDISKRCDGHKPWADCGAI